MRPLDVRSVRSNGSSPGAGNPTSLSSGSTGWTSRGLSVGVVGGTMSLGMTGFVSAGCGSAIAATPITARSTDAAATRAPVRRARGAANANTSVPAKAPMSAPREPDATSEP